MASNKKWKKINPHEFYIPTVYAQTFFGFWDHKYLSPLVKTNFVFLEKVKILQMAFLNQENKTEMNIIGNVFLLINIWQVNNLVIKSVINVMTAKWSVLCPTYL